MKNFDYCAYTYRHRKALEYTIKKVLKDNPELCMFMLENTKYHDLDKMVLYLFWDKPKASAYHKATSQHHITNNLEKSWCDYLEAVFDYECAAYTKPDKPLNAYDTTQKQYADGKISKESYDMMMGIMKTFGLDSSYTVVDDVEGMKYMEQFRDVTEEDILKEVLNYVSNNPNNSYKLNKDKI